MRVFLEWSCAALFVVVAWICLFLAHLGGLGVFLVLVAGWFLFRGARLVPPPAVDVEFAALVRVLRRR